MVLFLYSAMLFLYYSEMDGKTKKKMAESWEENLLTTAGGSIFTVILGLFESLFAKTHPADPAPIIM